MVCVPLTECDETQFESAPPSVFDDRQCTPVTVCTEKQFETVGVTATSDRVCANLTVCTAEQFQNLQATATSDRACSNLTLCDLDRQFVSVAATLSTDRQCGNLTECSADEFEAVPPTEFSPRVCEPLTACVVGQEVVTHPTASTDRVCRTCPAGTRLQSPLEHRVLCSPTFTAAACRGQVLWTMTATRKHLAVNVTKVCFPGRAQPLSVVSLTGHCRHASGTFQNLPGQTSCLNGEFVCPRGTQEVSAPSSTSSRVCEPCDGVTEFQDLADQTECKPITPCSPGRLLHARGPSSVRCAPVATCSSAAGSRTVGPASSTSNTQCAACDGVTQFQDLPGQVGDQCCKNNPTPLPRLAQSCSAFSSPPPPSSPSSSP